MGAGDVRDPHLAEEGQDRTRRFWSDDEKRRIVAQSYAPGVSVSVVARRYDVNANLIFTWRRDPRYQLAEDGEGTPSFLPVEVVPLSAVVGAGRGIGGSPTPAHDPPVPEGLRPRRGRAAGDPPQLGDPADRSLKRQTLGKQVSGIVHGDSISWTIGLAARRAHGIVRRVAGVPISAGRWGERLRRRSHIDEDVLHPDGMAVLLGKGTFHSWPAPYWPVTKRSPRARR